MSKAVRLAQAIQQEKETARVAELEQRMSQDSRVLEERYGEDFEQGMAERFLDDERTKRKMD